ncbi:hypothetical protein V7150_04660 [Neobacillus drentensis]
MIPEPIVIIPIEVTANSNADFSAENEFANTTLQVDEYVIFLNNNKVFYGYQELTNSIFSNLALSQNYTIRVEVFSNGNLTGKEITTFTTILRFSYN